MPRIAAIEVGIPPPRQLCDNEIIRLIGIVLTVGNLKWKVAAPDERALHKFNNSTYKLDSDHSPYAMEGSTTYTLPYWMGRYHLSIP